MMNDDNLNLRQLLRKLINLAHTATHGEVEQAITQTIEKIQECRFCAFEKEQREVNNDV